MIQRLRSEKNRSCHEKLSRNRQQLRNLYKRSTTNLRQIYNKSICCGFAA